MTRRILAAAALLLPLLGACDQQALTTPSALVAAAEVPTSIMDETTGEPVAINQPTADRVFNMPGGFGAPLMNVEPIVCDPYDPYCQEPPCDPIYDWGCEPCPRDNPDAWCYEPPCTITSIIDTYGTIRTGDEPTAGLEANGTGSTSCGGYLVLIGVGMRMDANDNLTTLHLKYQRVYADGTFGGTELRRYGSAPTNGLEGYAEALPGEVIVGIGVGSQSTHNIRTIRIWKRPISLTASGVRTTGSITAESFGYSPGGVLDTSYVIPLANTNQVYVGFGGRGHDHELKTAAHHIGTLK